MSARREQPQWLRVVFVYVLVQFAEIFGVSMIYAYLPLALERAGVALDSIAALSGAATAGIFLVGAPQVPVWLRVIVLVVAGVVSVGVLLTTTQGQAFLKLLKEAQVEARRVVWPTKEETWQTTLIVLAVVLVLVGLGAEVGVDGVRAAMDRIVGAYAAIVLDDLAGDLGAGDGGSANGALVAVDEHQHLAERHLVARISGDGNRRRALLGRRPVRGRCASGRRPRCQRTVPSSPAPVIWFPQVIMPRRTPDSPFSKRAAMQSMRG